MAKDIEVPDCEREADLSDHASKVEAAITEEGIRRTLRKVEKPPEDFDGIHCIDCGHAIPKDRLNTGAFRDIRCQEAKELRDKNHRSYYE